MPAIPRHARLRGVVVSNQDGERLGRVETVFVDARDRRARWISVANGWFRRRHRLLPLFGSRLSADGTVLLVPYAHDDVVSAPEHAPDENLDRAEERLLAEHYNVGYGTASTTGPHTGVVESEAPPWPPHGAVPAGDDYPGG